MKSLFLSLKRTLLPVFSAILTIAALPFAGFAQSNAALSIAISSPTNGTFYPAPTNIELAASVEPGYDAKTTVVFYDNSKEIGVSTNFAVPVAQNSPRLPEGTIYFLDWTNDMPGLHILTATASLNGTVVTSAPVTIQIATNTPTPPPAVQITEPVNGETFVAPTNITFEVSVYDPASNVADVSFTLGAGGPGPIPAIITELGSVSNYVSPNPPARIYTFTWSNAPAGIWSVGATATLTNGSALGSALVKFTIESSNVPPPPFSIDIASPTNGEFYPGPTNIQLIAGVVASNDTVTAVKFFDGSNVIGVSSNFVIVDPPGSPGLPPGSHAYFLDWTNDTPGSHTLTAAATDTSGKTVTSALVTISIGNSTPPPQVVQITKPVEGSMFVAQTNITFDVSVYDPASNVAYVSFAASPGGPGPIPAIVIEIGSVSNYVSPNPPTRIYTFTWSNAPTGVWFVGATASLTNGSALGSALVKITVESSNIPPPPFSIDIASPTNAEFYPGPTNIELVADVTVSNNIVKAVEFFDGTNLIGVSTNLGVVDPGFPAGTELYFLNWTNDMPGAHVLTATATVANGTTVTSAPVTITIGNSAPPPPPTITITQPTNGAVFTTPGNIPITASVDDLSGEVAYVSFTASFVASNSAIIATAFIGNVSNFVSAPPDKLYSLVWSNPPPLPWTLVATAVLSNGTSVSSTGVHITVEKGAPPPPVVTITQPANGAKFMAPANIPITASVDDPTANVAFVTFTAAPEGIGPQPLEYAILLGSVSNYVSAPPDRLYSVDWSNAPAGTWSITANAFLSNGVSAGAASVEIVVARSTNIPPVVRITSPANKSVFRAPVNVALVAYADALDGSVSSVEFFAGSNALGFGKGLILPIAYSLTSGGSPSLPPIAFDTNTFELIWSNAPPGTYAITAVATDNDGDTGTSAPVDITILPAPTPPTNRPAIVSIVATDPIAIAGTNCWRWLGGPVTWSNWISPAAIWTWYTNCGPKDATFTVTRIGGTNSDLNVDYAIGGTAGTGVDYATLPGSVTIPAGQSAAMITIVPIDAVTSIVAKTIVLELKPTTNVPVDYVLGVPRMAEGLIIDSEGPEPLGAFLPDGSFHLSLTGPDGAWFHIDYSTDLINWTTLCTNQVINGSIDFVDPNAAGSPTRQYRAVPIANPPSN